MEDASPGAREAVQGRARPTWRRPERQHARGRARLRAGEVDAIVRVPPDFRRLAAGRRRRARATGAERQQLHHRADAGRLCRRRHRPLVPAPGRARGGKPAGAGVEVVQRMWFNEAGISTWYLVPGLLVLVLTLIGAFLTSLLIAREWGARHAGIVVRDAGASGRAGAGCWRRTWPSAPLICCRLLAARFLFEVPMRGSLLIIFLGSMLYLTVSLLLGLFISGVTRNQFQASQIALLTSFMPAMMLSGFVFDLRNVPAVVRAVSYVLPATHFMGLDRAHHPAQLGHPVRLLRWRWPGRPGAR